MNTLKKRQNLWLHKLGPTAKFPLRHDKDMCRLMMECITGLDHTYALEFGGLKFILTHPYPAREAPFHDGSTVDRLWNKKKLPADLRFHFMPLPKGVGLYGFGTDVWLGYRKVYERMAEDLNDRLATCEKCGSGCVLDAEAAPHKGDFPQLACHDCGHKWSFYSGEDA